MLSGTLRSLTCQQRWRPPRSSAAAPIAHAPRTPLRPASWALVSPRVLTQGKEASRQSQSALLHAPVHSGQAVPGKGKDLGMQKVLSLSEPWTPEITFEVFQILLAQGRSQVSKSAPLSVTRQSLEPSGMGFLPHPNSSYSCHHPARLIRLIRLIRVSRFWVAALRQSSCEDGRMPANGSLELAKSGIERDSFCAKQALWPPGKGT